MRALANAKQQAYESARKVVQDALSDAVARAHGLLKAISHDYKGLVNAVEHHAKDCVTFQAALVRLEEVPAGAALQAMFPDTSGDYQLACRQGTAQVKKIRAMSKRRRTSLLHTLEVLGNDDGDLAAAE